MQRRERKFIAFRVVAVLAAAALAAGHGSGTARAQGRLSLDDLSFMAGCWQAAVGDGVVIRETFTMPGGGAILGNSQIVHGEETRFFEFIAVFQTDAGIVYRPYPEGRSTVSFPLIRSSATTAVFENPDHDFPQRISYRLDGEGILVARIEKMNGGNARSFSMEAVPCGGESHRQAVK